MECPGEIEVNSNVVVVVVSPPGPPSFVDEVTSQSGSEMCGRQWPAVDPVVVNTNTITGNVNTNDSNDNPTTITTPTTTITTATSTDHVVSSWSSGITCQERCSSHCQAGAHASSTPLVDPWTKAPHWQFQHRHHHHQQQHHHHHHPHQHQQHQPEHHHTVEKHTDQHNDSPRLSQHIEVHKGLCPPSLSTSVSSQPVPPSNTSSTLYQDVICPNVTTAPSPPTLDNLAGPEPGQPLSLPDALTRNTQLYGCQGRETPCGKAEMKEVESAGGCGESLSQDPSIPSDPEHGLSRPSPHEARPFHRPRSLTDPSRPPSGKTDESPYLIKCNAAADDDNDNVGVADTRVFWPHGVPPASPIAPLGPWGMSSIARTHLGEGWATHSRPRSSSSPLGLPPRGRDSGTIPTRYHHAAAGDCRGGGGGGGGSSSSGGGGDGGGRTDSQQCPEQDDSDDGSTSPSSPDVSEYVRAFPHNDSRLRPGARRRPRPPATPTTPTTPTMGLGRNVDLPKLPAELLYELHDLSHENEDLSAEVVYALHSRTFQIKELLGKGISSTVRRVTEKNTGKEFAVKIIDISGEKGEISQVELTKRDTFREILILRMCAGHPNIIELHDVFETPTFIFLVFEICKKGELFDYLTSVVSLSEKRTRIFMRQLLEAVAFFHEKNIVHRDLKPENILLDDDLNIKVSDFGFATTIKKDEELLELCGTPGYLAPEVLAHSMYENVSGYGKEVDMWALGVIMYTLLCGAPPFWNRRQMMMLRAIMNADYTFNSPEWDDITEAPKNLIQNLLVVNPEKRLTAKEALAHPFFHNQVSEEKKFHAIRKFKAGVYCVIFYLRLNFFYKYPHPISVDTVRSNPYSIKVMRKVIDNCAFGMYRHWVKRVDNQNRAALFEHALREDWKYNLMKADGSQS